MTQRIGLWASLLSLLVVSSPAAAQQPPPAQPPPAQAPEAEPQQPTQQQDEQEQPPQQQPPQAPPAQAPAQAAPTPQAPAAAETAPEPAAPPAEAAPKPPTSIDPAPPVPLPAQDLPGDTAPIDVTQTLTPEEEVSASEVAPAEQGDEIIVTGTRIRRSSAFEPSAPVEVIDREQLEYSGATNLADVVQYLTVAQGSGSQGAPGLGAGTVQVNLRGLGAGATLLLLNGRRVNPSAGGIAEHFGDLATIPMAAVERIEILKGGASAIYGADAVGGVVNIITRRNFDGARVEVDAQTTEELDQQDLTASAAFGASSERSRVMVAASYFRRTELTADERDFTKDSYISTQGNPGTYIVGVGTQLDPACSSVEGSFVQPGATGNDICAFRYGRFASLIGNGERANAYGSAEYDLTNHTTLFGEINVSRLRGDGVASTSLPIPPPFPVIPGDHVDNPFPGDVQWIGRPLGAEAGPQRNAAADDTLRGAIGLRGDLEGAAEDTVFEAWEWELFSTFGVSRYRFTFHDNLHEPLQAALNSCSDPSDLSGCFNPFYSAIDGTGTPNSREVIESFSGEMISMSDHALQTYNAGMTGPLFELPGGDLGVAFGAEVRHEWRTTELEHDANTDQYGFLVGNPDAKVARDVYSGYLELRWPLYDGIELQTAARVERYTDTDSTPVSPFAGITLTPAEIVGRDNVSDAFRRLQIRGHVASAFRAPTIYQSFPGYATIPTPLMTGGPLPTYIPVRSFGNPDLEPETALALSGGIMWSPVDQIGLTADVWHYDYRDRIDREDAQQIINEDMGNLTDPRIVTEEVSPGNFEISRINVQQLNLEGSVVTNGIDFGLMVNLDGADFGGSDDDFGLTFGAQGTYTMTYDIPRGQQASLQFADRTFAPPVDCEGSSAVDFDDDPTNDAQNDDDTCHVAGHRNENNFAPPIPRLRANFPIVFTASGHSATVMPRYISGLKDDVEPNMDRTLDDIDAWFAIDLQYGYTIEDFIGEELTARIGVYNLLDSDPPLVNGAAAAHETEVHDPRGRMFYAKLVSQF